MIIISGPAGAGKSTQAQFLAKKIDYIHISAGQLLRENATGKYKEIMDKGDLLPDEYVEEVLEQGLDKLDDPKKVILDGFPRNFPEARWLYEQHGSLVEHLILIELTEEDSVERLVKRGRHDDTPEAIKERLEIYIEETEGIVTYFEEQMLPITRIDGSGTPKQVSELIAKVFEDDGLVDEGSTIATQAEEEQETKEAEQDV